MRPKTIMSGQHDAGLSEADNEKECRLTTLGSDMPGARSDQTLINAPSPHRLARYPVPMDEWIIGQSEDGDRLYVVHTIAPRFIAAFSEHADECSDPLEPAHDAPKGAGVPPRGPMVRIFASGGGENPS